MTDESGDGVENVLQLVTSSSIWWSGRQVQRDCTDLYRSPECCLVFGLDPQAHQFSGVFHCSRFIVYFNSSLYVLCTEIYKDHKMNVEQPLMCCHTLDIIDMISLKGALLHPSLCRHYHTLLIKTKMEGI